MPTNEHPIERLVRVAIGLGLLSILSFGPVPGWGMIGLLGVVPLATGFCGTCPLYTLAGFSTAPTQE